MTDAGHAERQRKFWDRYIDILHKQGIKPPSERWRVLRAEQFIKVFPDRNLADHAPESVSGYLAEVGRQAG